LTRAQEFRARHFLGAERIQTQLVFDYLTLFVALAKRDFAASPRRFDESLRVSTLAIFLGLEGAPEMLGFNFPPSTILGCFLQIACSTATWLPQAPPRMSPSWVG
jgi:hypothetical protein